MDNGSVGCEQTNGDNTPHPVHGQVLEIRVSREDRGVDLSIPLSVTLKETQGMGETESRLKSAAQLAGKFEQRLFMKELAQLCVKLGVTHFLHLKSYPSNAAEAATVCMFLCFAT